MTSKIIEAAQKSLAGITLKSDEIVSLLDITIGSTEDIELREIAKKVALEKTNKNAYLWCAVGVDFVPCPMNCKFCSFGEKWNLIKENRHVSETELIDDIKRYVNGSASYIVLRTTEFYNIDKLLSFIPMIRNRVPGEYKIILNTGELDETMCDKLYDGGVYGIYHALRLRESIDTPFSRYKRIETMKNVSNSKLKLISLVEPIGPEHSNEEIADAFLNIIDCKAFMSGVMARFPVKGTPFGDTKMINAEKIAHIVAVLRLSGGDMVKDICSYPAADIVINSGANVTVVEAGAIPRDKNYSENDWKFGDTEIAKNKFINAGYKISYVRD